ncbi:MAG: palindromic element RPE4 domain-containing protein [Proteobacteria bacterium]|nr:palindromic element RPE4 domain-containing protein [Pseudomonadota bacterium]
MLSYRDLIAVPSDRVLPMASNCLFLNKYSKPRCANRFISLDTAVKPRYDSTK